jgi:hypothetical protein
MCPGLEQRSATPLALDKRTNMKPNILTTIVADVQFWIPVAVLLVGLGLLLLVS